MLTPPICSGALGTRHNHMVSRGLKHRYSVDPAIRDTTIENGSEDNTSSLNGGSLLYGVPFIRCAIYQSRLSALCCT